MSEEEKRSNDEAVEVETNQAEDIKALKQALEEKNKAERYLANWQRTQADFDNYKKRAGQESKEMIEFANRALVLNLLAIIGDLERALDSLPSELEEFSWVEGIKLIYNKLKATLEAQGLTEIKAEGELFDPHLHEAVMHREGEEGLVIEEIQKGYKFKDRILRPSMVIVGKGKGEKKTEQEIQEEE